jgi:glycosyltransferase involved in cell wall biosynthesis
MIESDGPGGAEQVVVHLALALHNAGAHSVVFVPADGEGWLARQLHGSGVAIEHFKVDQPVSRSCARTLVDGLRRHRIDVVHSHEFSMAVYGGWASWRAGIPHVITMHGSTYYAGRLRRRLALRAAIGTSGLTVAVSHHLAETISRDLGVARSRVHMVPNGVRCESASTPTLRAELNLAPGDRLLACVGNLYPVKGHRYLVDAMALIRGAHPSAHLAIAGRGDLAEALLSQARELGVADRVHLLGLRSDISSILADADVFVMPSLSEGLPMALLEAMVAGRPIVATDVGEVGYALARGEAGILVPPADAIQLAAALELLLGHRSRAMELGRRAAARVRAEYDVSRMVQRYVDGYNELTCS